MAQAPYSGKAKQDEFLKKALKAGFGPGAIVGYADIDSIIGVSGVRPWWLINAPEHRAARGTFMLPALGATSFAAVSPRAKVARISSKRMPLIPHMALPAEAFAGAIVMAAAAAEDSSDKPAPVVAAAAIVRMSKVAGEVVDQLAIPMKDSSFVPFGNFVDVKTIIQSEIFYPMFITGLSGNGKTMMVIQAAASARRELFRVNVTIETDEDDLLGGFRLVNGETRWFDGPVVEAMRRGAILLLDEVDLASNKIMCLQPVLEGKSILLKKINEIVTPARGFNIIATANTKGKGSEDGQFIGTNVLNEAFLERFAICFEQDYPTATVETKIVSRTLAAYGSPDEDFAKNLVRWAGLTRVSCADGSIDQLISTRRLDHIAKAYSIFNDKKKAISLALNRFDEETKIAIMDLYTKIDMAVQQENAAAVEPLAASKPADRVPF